MEAFQRERIRLSSGDLNEFEHDLLVREWVELLGSPNSFSPILSRA
jgi:hypothetical protein